MTAESVFVCTGPGQSRVYRVAGAPDGAALCAMLRDNPMRGWVDLCLERTPDYFAAGDLFGTCTSVVAETAAGQKVGMYACSRFDMYINGRPRPTAYLHSLRVNPAYRHRLHWLRDGFDSIAHLVPGFGETACCITSIASDNRDARRLLEAGLAGMPRYRPRGEMVSLLLPVRRRRPRGLLRSARRADIPDLLAFHEDQARRWQFAPRLSEDWLLGLSQKQGLALEDFWLLEERGRIRFCAALWDQRHCKQSVLRAYRWPLNVLRRPYNLWARAGGRLPLPAVGQRVEHLFIAFAAFEEGAAALALECIDELLAHAARKNASSAVLGLSAQHPLLADVRRRFHAETYSTSIETVEWPQQDAPALDERGAQPEVALL